MIRRDMRCDGRDGWALIAQPAHARLAGDLVRNWNDAWFPLVEPLDEFTAAVDRHDDGWIAWETRPTVVDGRPRNFLEMPIDESLAIWRRSIAVAQTIGPLAAFAVGGHFASLADRAEHREPHSPSWCDLVDEFLDEQRTLRTERLAQLRRTPQEDVGEAERRARRGMRLLQLFDTLSLWFCCREVPEGARFELPDGGEKLDLRHLEPGRATVEPWPFRPRELQIRTDALWLPATPLNGPEDLARVEKRPLVMQWTLVAA